MSGAIDKAIAFLSAGGPEMRMVAEELARAKLVLEAAWNAVVVAPENGQPFIPLGEFNQMLAQAILEWRSTPTVEDNC